MWKDDPEQGLQEVTASVALNLRLYDKKSEQKDIKHKHAAYLVLFKEAFQFGGRIRCSLCNATAQRKHPKWTFVVLCLHLSAECSWVPVGKSRRTDQELQVCACASVCARTCVHVYVWATCQPAAFQRQGSMLMSHRVSRYTGCH